MRTRLWLMLALVLLLSVGAFQYFAKRPSADTVTSTKSAADIKALVNSINLSASRSYAGACPPASSLGAVVCSYGSYYSLLSQPGVVRSFATGVLDEIAEVCLDRLINNPTGANPNPGECTTKVPPGTTDGQLNAKMTFNGGEFPSIFKFGKTDIKVNDKADISGNVSGNYTFTNSTDLDKALASLKFDEDSLDGSLKGTIYHQVEGRDDMSSFLGDAYPMLTVDKAKSQHIVEFTGLLNYGIDAKFKVGQEQLSVQTFCPKQCAIWNKNTLILSGSINKGFDFGDNTTSTGGLVEINVSHEENYKGTGSSKEAEFFTWSNDLEVVKNDRRSWNIDVALAKGSPNVNWVGSYSSSANIKPFQKQQLIKTSNIESFAYPGPWRPSGDPRIGLLPPEHNLLLDNLLTQDKNGTITRSGKSSYTVEKSEMYSGIYDNKDARLLVLSRAGRKLKPPQRLDDTDGPKQSKFYTTLWDQFFMPLVQQNTVPGYFYAGDGKAQATVISTSKYQALPANVLITIGFKKDEQEDHYVSMYIDSFSAWLKERGVAVTVAEARNRLDLLDAWNSASNGTLIIHFGHGGAGFLAAGDDLVSYYTLADLIRKKSMMLAGFFAESCFSASAQGPLSPVALKIAGSVGTGFDDGSASNLGDLFGVGTNNFQYSSGKLLADVMRTYYSGVTGCSSSSSGSQTPNPTPGPNPGSGSSPSGSSTTNPPTTVNPPATTVQPTTPTTGNSPTTGTTGQPSSPTPTTIPMPNSTN